MTEINAISGLDMPQYCCYILKRVLTFYITSFPFLEKYFRDEFQTKVLLFLSTSREEFKIFNSIIV